MLKQHLQNVHPQHKDKDDNFSEHRRNDLKKMKLDSTWEFQEMNQKVTQASCIAALKITLEKITHTTVDFDKTLHSQNGGNCVGKWPGGKLAAVSLSTSTVQKRISNTAIDIKDQVCSNCLIFNST